MRAFRHLGKVLAVGGFAAAWLLPNAAPAFEPPLSQDYVCGQNISIHVEFDYVDQRVFIEASTGEVEMLERVPGDGIPTYSNDTMVVEFLGNSARFEGLRFPGQVMVCKEKLPETRGEKPRDE